MEGIFQELGELALASRLKRLSANLMSEVKDVYRQFDFDFDPRWFLPMQVIHRNGDISILEMSQIVGLSHAAINKISKEMESAGIIVSITQSSDKRKRFVSLTEKGLDLFRNLQVFWNAIDLEVKDLLKSVAGGFMTSIDQIEYRLQKEDLSKKIVSRYKRSLVDLVEIVEYTDDLSQVFYDINHSWLSEYFELEEMDYKILRHPKEEILDIGGFIYFAKLNNKIVGTVSLIPNNETEFELIKMGVLKEARGKQVGRKLLDVVMDRARSEGAKSVYLETHSVLKAALQLYLDFGFTYTASANINHEYSRDTFAMVYSID